MDRARYRLIAVFVLSGVLILLATIIQTRSEIERVEGWLTNFDALRFIPYPALRFIEVFLTWESLKYSLLPMITILLGLIVGGRFIQDVYNLNGFWVAFRYLLASIFGFLYPYLRIEKGEMVLFPDETNPLAIIGGPGFVAISPGNAVLFEYLRSTAAVRGAGTFFIDRFERIKQIIDLRDQHGTIESTQAMSRDGLLVTVRDIRFRYRLAGGRKISRNTGRVLQEPFPFSSQAIRNMVYNRSMLRNGNVTPWAVAVSFNFDGEITDFVRKSWLDQVTAPEEPQDPRLDIRRALNMPGTRSRLRSVGAELLWFDIGHFEFDDPAIEEQRILAWGADFIGDSDVIRAFGDAKRKADMELARAETQAELVLSLVYALREAGLDDDVRGEAMQKLILLKTAQVLEAMSKIHMSTEN
jgi:hypothetical protein